MGILDGIIGQIEGQAAAAIAAKMGIDPSMAQTAINALTNAHPQPGDTVQVAAASTGMPTDQLNEILGHLGGEGALGKLAASLGGGEAAGGGGIGGAISGMLGGLMGGNKS